MEIPGEHTASIWRYLDFTKYVSMLDTESLYFCRADRFEDPYEGIPHPSFIEEQRKAIWDALSFDWGIALDTWQEMDLKTKYEAARSRALVNCWHENDHESAAMWRLYLNSPEGIAIRSTAEQLKKSITGHTEVQIARVEYVDFASPLDGNVKLNLSETLKPFFLKRLTFAHEREIRAIVEVNQPPEHGLAYKVQLGALISSIHVSPLAPDWFLSLVKSVNQRYGITKIPVLKSKLYETPMVQVPATPY